MSTNSNIEWTESTWNPMAGCTPVSPGCLHCYAATMAYRLEKMGQEKYRGLTVLRNGVRTFNGKLAFDDGAFSIPLKKKAPTTYFVNSMSDLFHEDVPDDFLNRLFSQVMERAQQHTYQILTKRAERMATYMKWRWGGGRIPCRNIWLGVSIEGRKQLARIDAIREMPAAVRFLSCEPLLEDLGELDLRGIHWVIVGGESGGSKKSPARECNIEWIRNIVRQCNWAKVPCFVKQLGSQIRRTPNLTGYLSVSDRKGGNPDEWPVDLRVRQMPLFATR